MSFLSWTEHDAEVAMGGRGKLGSTGQFGIYPPDPEEPSIEEVPHYKGCCTLSGDAADERWKPLEENAS